MKPGKGQEPVASGTFEISPSPFPSSFPGSSRGKEPIFQCRRRDEGSIPGWGRSPGGGHGKTPVLLPEEPHEQKSLAGYSP